MNRMTRLFIGGLLCLCAASGYSQTKIDWDRMERDLDIMEGIIGKLLGQNQQRWSPFDQGVKGLYFEGYGVLFYVPPSNMNGLIFRDVIQEQRLKARELQEMVQQFKGKLANPSANLDSEERARLEETIRRLEEENKAAAQKTEEPIREAKQRIEQRNKKLIEFLKYYADAINQLNDEDRISIIIDQKASMFGPKTDMRIGEPVSKNLQEISASKKDIVAYRKGKIGDTEFENLVTIREIQTDDNVLKEVDVFAGIIGTALGRNRTSGLNTGDDIRGMHIRGLGAVFFMSAQLNQNFDPVLAPAPPEAPNGNSVTVVIPSFKGHSEDTDKAIKEFKRELVGVLGDYGHTLRMLKDSEYIVVSVDLSGLHFPFGGDHPGGFVAKVQKNVLDQYDARSIDFNGLMNKIQFIDL